ncbi:MAG: bifunctional methylenetetrahydrofolate dehydrogenase/methenyltetrahydrofolate cyclohydrolase FolD [Firmicutes bacterium]|nr:bifunctional methylenetetrahydrofolate dehydrogenase/methenyltetrahydrofolate cyclohydrolase FolD [Bacillota bacterium]
MNTKGIIIDGKLISQKIKDELRLKVQQHNNKHDTQIGLAVVLVGENQASQVYVRNKVKACDQVGIKSFVHKLDETISADEVTSLIKELNNNPNINGILIQLPLPKHLNEDKILALVDPSKDVDGFHIHNAAGLFLGHHISQSTQTPILYPCTPSGIIELVKSTGESIEGKHAVVIGRSNIVGKPVAMMLLSLGCTVTICHSKTKDLPSITKQADILVVAIGRKEFISGDMVKPGSIVIDVGINRHEGKIYGDVNFDQAKQIAKHITPVPGGVGPMTIAMLLSNTLKASEK